jgi:hypothetical protein
MRFKLERTLVGKRTFPSLRCFGRRDRVQGFCSVAMDAIADRTRTGWKYEPGRGSGAYQRIATTSTY